MRLETFRVDTAGGRPEAKMNDDEHHLGGKFQGMMNRRRPRLANSKHHHMIILAYYAFESATRPSQPLERLANNRTQHGSRTL